ncbi:putative nucleoredoxin 1, partial [Cucurbita argyrosperma subsp. sororia]
MASDAVHDINSLVSSKDRDFLIRNNGDQVKISSLVGKNVGLYFSASWCIPCCLFTPKLAKVYEPLASKSDFEVIFISSDRDENSFKEYFSKMPWLSIPFADLETKKSLKKLFNVNGIPHLVVLDAKGKVSTEEGVDLVVEYGVDAYPFTSQQIQALVDKEAKKMNQTISSLLVSKSRSYVVSSDGNQIPVSELEGKLIGLYFSMHGHKLCDEFTQKLIEAYKKLKEKGENFEIVLISLDDKDENLFKEAFKTMPWLALPFKDEKCQELKQYLEVSDIPSLVIIGTDGKTSNPNAVELINEHGIDAYPFAPKKIEGVDEVSNTKLESESPKPVLVCGAKDLDLEKNKGKVKVSCCSGEMSKMDEGAKEEKLNVTVSCCSGETSKNEKEVEEEKPKVKVSCCSDVMSKNDEKVEEKKSKVKVSCCSEKTSKNDKEEKDGCKG